MSDNPRAFIDLSALEHNLRKVRALVGARQILAMVKANGYGHGMVTVAKGLREADAFGVASFDEAIALREAAISQPIFVLSRFEWAEQVTLAALYRLSLVVNQPFQVEILQRSPAPEPITVWLKLETGMHRLGLLPDQFLDAWQRLERLSWINQPVGLMTHLACADDPDHPLTNQQIELFQKLTINFPGPKSIANSAAIVSHPESLADWVRPGIMLYGASPVINQTGEQLGLRPVMTLTADLIAVNSAKPGDCVGYGATWQCPEEMPIGIVAIGYGDGYPRHARTGTPVLINGSLCPLIGRVSMDMIAVDLRPAPQAKVGDSVVLWGKGLPVEQIADCAETISYELFCHVTQRVEFTS